MRSELEIKERLYSLKRGYDDFMQLSNGSRSMAITEYYRELAQKNYGAKIDLLEWVLNEKSVSK